MNTFSRIVAPIGLIALILSGLIISEPALGGQRDRIRLEIQALVKL